MDTENHPKKPISPYGETKLKIEEKLPDYYKKYGFTVKHTYSFHTKKSLKFDVTLLRILTKI